jgi:hypothetical protein
MSCESLIKRLPDSFVATNLPGVYAAKPLAEHFDWCNPNETYRKRHGIIWSHLDEERAHPTRATAWKTVSSLAWNPTQHLIPEFAVSAGVRKRLLPTLTDAISNSWAGVVCQKFLRQTLYDLTITAQPTRSVRRHLGRPPDAVSGRPRPSLAGPAVLQFLVDHVERTAGDRHLMHDLPPAIDEALGSNSVNFLPRTNRAIRTARWISCTPRRIRRQVLPSFPYSVAAGVTKEARSLAGRIGDRD